LIEDRNDSLISLEAEIAQDYSKCRGAQLLARVTLAEIDAELRILELTRAQARVGLTSQGDVQSALAQLVTLTAQLPQFESQTDKMMDALTVLTGKSPGALDTELQYPGAAPPVPPIVPLGLRGCTFAI
jgi:outer membrane protein TolC